MWSGLQSGCLHCTHSLASSFLGASRLCVLPASSVHMTHATPGCAAYTCTCASRFDVRRPSGPYGTRVSWADMRISCISMHPDAHIEYVHCGLTVLDIVLHISPLIENRPWLPKKSPRVQRGTQLPLYSISQSGYLRELIPRRARG